MPSIDDFAGQIFSVDNLEFLFACLRVGGFSAEFAIPVVSVPIIGHVTRHVYRELVD